MHGDGEQSDCRFGIGANPDLGRSVPQRCANKWACRLRHRADLGTATTSTVMRAACHVQGALRPFSCRHPELDEPEQRPSLPEASVMAQLRHSNLNDKCVWERSVVAITNGPSTTSVGGGRKSLLGPNMRFAMTREGWREGPKIRRAVAPARDPGGWPTRPRAHRWQAAHCRLALTVVVCNIQLP